MLRCPEGEICSCNGQGQHSLSLDQSTPRGSISGSPTDPWVLGYCQSESSSRVSQPNNDSVASEGCCGVGARLQDAELHRCRCALRPGRWAMTDLQLRGTGILLADVDLSALIGRPMESSPLPHPPPSRDSNGHCFHASQDSRQASRGLRSLALSGLPLISDVFLWSLGRCQGSNLEHLCLERCGSAKIKSEPSSGDGRSLSIHDHGRGKTAFASWNVSQFGLGLTVDGIQEMLRACHGIRSLRLIHCCEASLSLGEIAQAIDHVA